MAQPIVLLCCVTLPHLFFSLVCFCRLFCNWYISVLFLVIVMPLFPTWWYHHRCNTSLPLHVLRYISHSLDLAVLHVRHNIPIDIFLSLNLMFVSSSVFNTLLFFFKRNYALIRRSASSMHMCSFLLSRSYITNSPYQGKSWTQCIWVLLCHWYNCLWIINLYVNAYICIHQRPDRKITHFQPLHQLNCSCFFQLLFLL